MHFDIFTIQQWQECYTLRVGISRPSNAPRNKHTKADRKRLLAANAKNLELIDREFTTLEDVVQEIQHLQFPLVPVRLSEDEQRMYDSHIIP